ncbi:hypothetical protein BpHYR1_043550 [Brachionus plicatilis]|uniref:Uncharacterized protein n=1 Tax=Brachionus plicatilis TaxID=10195 RepID=A0A3M7PXG9_BRAPC|nr:hypothetical protein BpHYR1_043550 [Brachionus plicatilis]
MLSFVIILSGRFASWITGIRSSTFSAFSYYVSWFLAIEAHARCLDSIFARCDFCQAGIHTHFSSQHTCIIKIPITLITNSNLINILISRRLRPKTNDSNDSLNDLLQTFETEKEFNEFITGHYLHTKITNSETRPCSCASCKNYGRLHDMRRIYRILSKKKGKHVGTSLNLRKTRGINPLVKDMIQKIIAIDPDIIPSCIHNTLINSDNISTALLPKLKQIQNFVTNLRNRKINTNSIPNQHLYSSILDDDEPFFFNLKFNEKGEIIVNSGSESNHLSLMLTTKRLLSRIDMLMCYFHRHIRDIHISINEEEYNSRGRFCDWQVFKRPICYACTNSPNESFNSSIKRTFTLRKKLSFYNFIGVLLKMARYYSKNLPDFAIE